MKKQRINNKISKSSLLNYRKNVFSQFGEDGVIEHIFRKIPHNQHPWGVELGAWDGRFCSNICNLVENQRWRGVFIEGDRHRFKDLLKNHGSKERVHCITTFVRPKGSDNLDSVLVGVGELPKDFDLLSIDIDGLDYYIWESLHQFNPKAVILEFNPTIPVDFEYVQAEDFFIHDGCSLLSLVKLGKRKGYELICCTDTNAFFCREKYYNRFGLKNNLPEKMFRPFASMYQTKIWQGGDGRLHLIGCDRLLWHNFRINEKKIQVLPRFLRFHPGVNSSLLHFLQQVKNRIPLINKLVNFIVVGKWEPPPMVDIRSSKKPGRYNQS